MKNVLQSIVLLLLFLFIGTTVNAQWLTDSEYGFKIKVPSNWTKEKKQDGTDRVHDFLDPTQNIFIEVRAFKTGTDFTPDALAQVFENSALPGAEKLAYENYTLNGTAGKFGGYRTTINGLTVGVGAFYAVTPGYSYIIWSLIPIEVYNQYSGAGDKVLNTFTVLKTTVTQNTTKKNEAPTVTLTAFKISDEITNDYDIVNQKKTFKTTTPTIWVVYDWKGNGNGSLFEVNWFYEGQFINGASKQFKMPDYMDGYGYANITMDGGFKVGNYRVEVKVAGKVLGTIQFKVEANAGIAQTAWGKANGNTNSVSQNQGKARTVKLGGSTNYYSFKKGIVRSSEDADILNEPWCTQLPALCGNWARTGKKQLNQVTSPPASGYISDGLSYTDCQQVPINEVLVFKLKDGTYGKVIVVNDNYSKTNSACNHDITLLVEYPAF